MGIVCCAEVSLRIIHGKIYAWIGLYDGNIIQNNIIYKYISTLIIRLFHKKIWLSTCCAFCARFFFLILCILKRSCTHAHAFLYLSVYTIHTTIFFRFSIFGFLLLFFMYVFDLACVFRGRTRNK